MRAFLGRVAIATLIALPLPRAAGSQSASRAESPRGPIWATLSARRGDLQVNRGPGTATNILVDDDVRNNNI